MLNAYEDDDFEDFRSAIHDAGLGYIRGVVEDGQVYRFHIDGDSVSTLNGWYVLQGGANPWGAFGCWKRNIKESWSRIHPDKMPKRDRKAFEQHQRTVQKKLQEEKANVHKAAAEQAEEIFYQAQGEWARQLKYGEIGSVIRRYGQGIVSFSTLASTVGNNYLERKGLTDLKGISIIKQELLIPLYDENKSLCNLQFIKNSGQKRFKKGGKKKGCCHFVGLEKKHDDLLDDFEDYLAAPKMPLPKIPPEKIYVCEGYSTGASIYQALQKEAVVAVAFDAGNLLPAAKTIRQWYPEAEIIFAADNDHRSETNTGLSKASEAARTIGGYMAYPRFNKEDEGSDFNDLYLSKGADAVLKALLHTTDGFSPLNPHDYDGSPVAPSKPDTTIPDKPKDNSSRSTYEPGNELQIFSVRDSGVYYLGDEEPFKICARLEVTAKTRDADNGHWGRLLEWQDDDTHHHQWAMPMDMLAGNGEELRKALLRGGLPFIASTSRGRKLIQDYISTQEVKSRARCVSMTGWHGNAFVLPDQVIGATDNDDRVILQTSAGEYNHFKQSGTLDEWQQHISHYCVGNSRLVFAASMAFAAPLLSLVGAEGGGFNFRGDSAEGKSTALQVACSICGGRDYLHTWRATGNGLEGTAVNHNDALLALDEMDEADPAEVGNIAYMLANGMGKQRADRDGGTRLKKQWRTLFISSGESSLGEHMGSAGKRAKAGQEVRLADVPMNTGGQYKGFETVHDQGDGAGLANYLKEQTTQYHGTALRAYLNALIPEVDKVVKEAKAIRDRLIKEMVPAGADGQVSRVASRFALVAAGGELASQYQITGWPKGEAENAARVCFQAWLDQRGGIGSLEDNKLLKQLVGFFEAHGQSRFATWDIRGSEKINNRAGFVQLKGGDTTFYVFPTVFKDEVCQGFDPKRALALLTERDWLTFDKGKTTAARKPPGENKSMRFYVIKGEILGGE